MPKKQRVETQKKITNWCQKHYPDQTREQRLRDIFEEATELAAGLNVVSLNEILDVVRKSWKKSKSDLGDFRTVPGEIADLQIAIAWLASELKLDTQQALSDKMKINRKKTTAQSQSRLDRKDRIFKK